MSFSRVCLVTGSNQGIGYSIAKQLALGNKDLKVLLGVRDLNKGKEAIEKLIKEEGISHKQLDPLYIDLDDDKSIDLAAETVKQTYPNGLNILVNNAGMAFKGDRFDEQVCRISSRTNYIGTRKVIESFQPILSKNARVVNVSSMSGRSALQKMSEENRNKLLADDLTFEQLDTLMEEFYTSVKDGKVKERGWPEMGYGMSKAAESMMTRIVARDFAKNGITYNACCPGYVNTSMTSHKGIKTPDQGAETPVFLANIPADAQDAPNGKFFEDCKEKPWV